MKGRRVYKQLLHVPPVYAIQLGIDTQRIAWFWKEGKDGDWQGPYDSKEAAQKA